MDHIQHHLPPFDSQDFSCLNPAGTHPRTADRLFSPPHPARAPAQHTSAAAAAASALAPSFGTSRTAIEGLAQRSSPDATTAAYTTAEPRGPAQGARAGIAATRD
uniref:Uncharacterized protein n=1 Tax=Eutreptiella gymnastica TaxID=73025 RepID=A0A7S4LDN4_9EUGL